VRRRREAREARLAQLNHRLTLAYDGTDFEGWQIQKRGGARTVQGVLEQALGRLAGGAPVRVASAGRTDAGVHALGQVVTFALARSWQPDELLRALNGLLPADVRVLQAGLAPAAFHARRSALSKHYRYTLDTARVQDPLRRRYAGHAPGPLDLPGMREAAAAFLGRHDFASLQSSGGSVQTTVRGVTQSALRREADVLLYEVAADGFLRKMVRSMVGGLLAVGRGEWSVDALRRALLARDRSRWPAPAEARGLTLMRVVYGSEFEGVR
jgi:tRNA pseudouridine38-40 synthase